MRNTSLFATRLEALRKLMAQRDLDAYMIPSQDEHQGEFVPERAKRIHWLSGFSGSSGTLLVTSFQALLWTDGRYHLQAQEELDKDLFTLMRMGLSGVPEPQEWLLKNLPPGKKVGIDPRLFSIDEVRRLKRELSDGGIELVSLEENLVDLLWEDKPPAPSELIWPLAPPYCGSSVEEKLATVRGEMARNRVQGLVVSRLDEIAWILNLRGKDVPYNPVFLSYLVILENEALLFIDGHRLTKEARDAMEPVLEIRPYGDFEPHLRKLAKAGIRFWVDPQGANQRIVELLEEGPRPFESLSPIARAKAVKSPAERRGMRDCHIREALAWVRFIRWIKEEVPRGGITEKIAAEKLDSLREGLPGYVAPSFETIVAYGPNGAIVHYRPSHERAIELRPHGLVLVDSGGHFLDGTTDATRTIALGHVTDDQREKYTRVLKGHIALSTTPFPKGTSGRQLDSLARRPLWEVGMDYMHGTGHGVGCFLNVHEGPQSISPKDKGVPLEPGMFLTNEPGYYEEGSLGIRIENVMEVIELPMEYRTHGPFLGFQTVTMIPLERSLISVELLQEEEISWINSYHRTIRDLLSPHLTGEDLVWLQEATTPIE